MGIPIKYEALIENFDRCLKFFEDLETKAEEAKARKNAKGNGGKKENKLNQIDLEQFKDDFKYIDKLYGSGINNPGLSLAITNFEPEKKEKWLREFISKLAILGTEKDKGSVGNIEMRNRISRKINSLKKELKEVLDKIQKLVDEGNVPFPLKSDEFKANLKMCIEKVDFYYDETVENKAKKDDKTDEEARKAIEDDAKGIIPYKESSIAEGIRMIQSKDSGDFKGKMRYLIDEINKEGSYRGISLLDGKDAEGNNKCKNISLLKKILVNHTLGHFGLDDDKVQDAVDNLDYAIKMKKNAEGRKAYKAELENRKAKRKIAKEVAEEKKEKEKQARKEAEAAKKKAEEEEEKARAAKEKETKEREKREQEAAERKRKEEEEKKEREKKEQEAAERKRKEEEDMKKAEAEAAEAERKKKEQEAAEAAAAARKAEEEKLRAAKEKEEKEKEKREQEAAERKRKEEEEKKEREKKEQESAEAERKRKEAEAAILGAILSISGNEVPSSLGGISGGAICKALEKRTYTSENFINTLCECKDELRQNRNSENNESEFLYDALLCIESEKDEKRKEGVEIIYDEKKLEELKSILEPAGEKQTPQAAEEKKEAALPTGETAVEEQSQPRATDEKKEEAKSQPDLDALISKVRKELGQVHDKIEKDSEKKGKMTTVQKHLKKFTGKETETLDEFIEAVYNLAWFLGRKLGEKWLYYNQLKPLQEHDENTSDNSIDTIKSNLQSVKEGLSNKKENIELPGSRKTISINDVNIAINDAIACLNDFAPKQAGTTQATEPPAKQDSATDAAATTEPQVNPGEQQSTTTSTAASSAKQQAKAGQSEQQSAAAEVNTKPGEGHAGNLSEICISLKATLIGLQGDNQQCQELLTVLSDPTGSNIEGVIKKISEFIKNATNGEGTQIELAVVEEMLKQFKQLAENSKYGGILEVINLLEEYKRLKEVDKIEFGKDVTTEDIRVRTNEISEIIEKMREWLEKIKNKKMIKSE